LALLVLLPISMVYSCIKGPAEPTGVAALPTPTVRVTSTPYPTYPTSPYPTTISRRPSTATTTSGGVAAGAGAGAGADVDAPDPDRRRTTTSAKRSTTAESGGSVYYANCAAVRAAGKAPIRRGQPGYRAGLDSDGDGQGCGAD
jgi:hypothetical protein